MPTLRRLAAPLVFACMLLVIMPALGYAWDQPAGSPPDWQPYWVQTTERVAIYSAADGDLNFGEVVAGQYFRVDGPALRDRFWVYDPLGGWAWLPISGTHPVPEPTLEQVQATADPRAYLYLRAPDLAPRLDCIIAGESGWDPSQQNPYSRASGLAQFLPSTWATTPEGQSGLSPFEPFANIDAAIWLARTKGWTQWQVYTVGRCH